MIKNNRILLSKRKLNLSTLAEPQTIVRLNSSAIIKIGSEIPIKSVTTSSGEKTESTLWKFVGLQLTLGLKRVGNRLQLDYKTEFGQKASQSGEISGSGESSSTFVKMGVATQLFQVGLRSNGQDIASLPWLGAIPILGHLFQSKSKHINYKQVTGILVVEKVEE